LNNYYSPYELRHIGVLGMHWGIRKKEESKNINGVKARVSESKKTYDQAIKKMRRETIYGLIAPSKNTLSTVKKATLKYNYSLQDLKSTKILEKLNSKPKSKLQLSTEEKYKEKGMNNDEAAIAAYQNIKTKKILAVVAATVAASATGYAIYKYRDARVDKIIKADTLLQNISSDSTQGVRDAFYSSKNKLDNIKYQGLYGEVLSNNSDGAIKKQIKVLSDIKQASYKSAKDTLSELVSKDEDFKKNISDYFNNNYVQLSDRYDLIAEKAKNSLSKGIVDKNVYDFFNASLVDHSEERQPLNDKFFEALRSKGYNALKDVNDSKYSGYQSINPIIAFNTKGLVDVVDIKKLTDSEISKSKNIAYSTILGSELVKQGAIVVGSFLTANKIKSTIANGKNVERVQVYRKEHPNTKLSNTEISRMLELEGA